MGSLYPLASCVKEGSDSETKSLFWSRLVGMSANLGVIQDQGGLGTKSQAGDHHHDQTQDEHFDHENLMRYEIQKQSDLG